MRRDRQKLIGLTIAALVVSAIGVQAHARTKTTINDGWRFYPGDPANAATAPTGPEWQRINVPHTWNAEDVLDDTPGYRRGIGWYRRDLSMPASLKGKRIYLYFEGVGQTAEVFVNGRSLGNHIGGYTAFTFDITEAIRFDGPNVIAVKADNTRILDNPPIDGDFNMYGGIYRDVWLIATDDVHLSFGDSAAPGVVITTPRVTAESATAQVAATIINKGSRERSITVRTVVYDPDGKQVAEEQGSVRAASGRETHVSHREFRISSPRLWSPDSPSLYRVITRVEDGGRVIDEVSQPLGFRWFSFDAAKGFFLNGKPLKLRGTNRHQDHAGLGNALPDSYHVRDLEIIKENGFNFLRLAHYPQDPAVLEAANRLGLLIWEEIPIVNQIHVSKGFNDNAKLMLREMIRQHRNHPSIILWGYMNEVYLPVPKTEEHTKATVDLAKELEAICKSEDPTRATAIAFDWGARDKYHASGLGSVTDVVGWNLYHGWYYETFDDFGKFMDDQHRRYPTRPLIVSEFGANADRRVHSDAPRRFDSSIEWQQMFHESFLRQIEDRPYIAGSNIWNQFDFASEFRGETIPHINQKGMFSFDRQPKDISYLYRASYSAKPVVHIATRDRLKRSGTRRQKVKVYTNISEVEMFHNGRSVGKRSGVDSVKSWDVDLVGGRNSFRAVGGGLTDVAAVTYIDPSETSLIAINVGSNTEVIDSGGVLWQADVPVEGAKWNLVSETSKPEETLRNILGTVDDALFQRMREGNFGYTFSVPDGQYEIDLRFVERKHTAPSQRVFKVMINGIDSFGPIDLFAEAGLLRQVSRKVRVAAVGGRGLDIRLEAVKDVPTLSGIIVKRII
jgi:beta-galactosidase